MKEQKAARKALEKELDVSNVASIEELGGDAKHTFDVQLQDKNLIVHICSEDRFEKRFETEALILQKVKNGSSLPAPKVLASDISKENVPYMYLVTEKVSGYNPRDRFKYLPVKTRKKILFRIGRYIGTQHRELQFQNHGHFSCNKSNTLTVDSKSWTDTVQGMVETFLDDIEWSLYKQLIPIARETVEENLSIIEGDFQPVLLHNDYSCDNILLEDDKVSAILDWEMAMSGHKEYDFFKADKRFIDAKFQTKQVREEMRKHLYEGYLSVNSFDKGWKQRRKFYRYINIIEGLRVFHEYQSELSQQERENRQKFHKKYIKNGIGSKEDYLYK